MTNVNRSNPDVIIQFHNEYIEAGADIITTNTFRTNPWSLFKAGKIDVSYYVSQAVGLARQASAKDCYQIERELSNK
jgi:homocysteine S-methyltransferase